MHGAAVKISNSIAMRTRRAVISVIIAGQPCLAHATNGMNLEGYGPEALGMGGASFAYDNGAAATINNPATIGLMREGHRADFAVGFLGPNVMAEAGGSKEQSGGDAYYMPAFGWLNRKGSYGYGVGVFAQGGMGTEYSGSSFLAAGSGEPVRSELGVGRLMLPLTYEVNPRLILGGSVDFVWAGLDLKMAMTGAQFGDMVATLGGTQSSGVAAGSAVDGLVANIGSLLNNGAGAGAGFGTGPVNWARFDFSNDNSYTGAATGTGTAAKIGAVFKPNPQLAVGVTYHTKTALGDLVANTAKLSMNANVDTGLAAGGAPSGTYAAQTIAIDGKLAVKDFQWPATFGVGTAWQATSELMFAVDIKRIFWADVMKSFNMHFTADAAQSGLAAGFAGTAMDAQLYQDWSDQTAIALGGAYKLTPQTTLRAGYNRASNQIPDRYLNALFPAIEERHVTVGAGYAFNPASSVDFTLSKGLNSSAVNPQNNVTSTMRQLNWQWMYSYRY